MFTHPRRPGFLLLALLLAALGLARADDSSDKRTEARTHLRAARKAAQQRDFTRAKEELAKCLRLGLDNADVRLLAARTARRAGDYKEAEKQLAEYERLKGRPETIRLEKSLLRAQRGELAGVEKGLLADVKKGHPDSVLILEAVARGRAEAGRLRDVQAALDDWVKQHPRDAQALLLQTELKQLAGDSWGGSGQVKMYLLPYVETKNPPADTWNTVPAAAVAGYREVVKLDPDNDTARLRLAEGLLDSAAPQEALAHFERLQKRQPKNAAVRLGLARCQLMLGKADEAEKLLDRLLLDHPRYAAALAERGKLLLQQGKAAEAEKALRRAAELAPSNPEVLYRLVVCLRMTGKGDEAEKTIQRFRQAQGDRKRIEALLRKIDESATDPAPRCEVGALLLRTGREEEGVRWLHRALQLDPRHRPAHKALADYYRRVGNKDLAEKHRKQAQ